MCLAIPAKVVKVKRNVVIVDVLGEKREVKVNLIKPKIGDYVIVQFGFITDILDKKVAEEGLKAWKELRGLKS